MLLKYVNKEDGLRRWLPTLSLDAQRRFNRERVEGGMRTVRNDWSNIVFDTAFHALQFMSEIFDFLCFVSQIKENFF